MSRCSMCGGAGWIVDCKPSQSPVMLELIECPLPDCGASGRPVASISFKGPRFRAVHTHPSESYVMSLSGADRD